MTAQPDLAALAEELRVSRHEHPDVHSEIIARAIDLARNRGGQTIPVSIYDIQRAEDEAAGFTSESAKLRAELAAVKAELSTLRARALSKDQSHDDD